jgi:GNAT superfamily N-acetyltransferase
MPHADIRFHRIDPEKDRERLRRFLSAIDPADYLLEGLTEWIREGRHWVAIEARTWVAFGRLHDLGDGEGWLSGARVVPERRGQGLGAILLERLISEADSTGISDLRVVIEDENIASSRLVHRFGFRPIQALTVRVGSPAVASDHPWHRASPVERLDGPVGWLASIVGRVDLLPGSDGGRFGAWRSSLVARWASEQKLYLGPDLAVGIQTDWWRNPRTLWVSPLRGDLSSLLPALGGLTNELGHEQWQAFLPSSEELRAQYERYGLKPHPHWGDRAHLYERGSHGSSS